ncbi:hypothetical protein C6H68_16090 [Photorhabdus luminescens]|nr:hypothetical protein C6H68_16090 [Photorhabdus luminescens]
MDWFIKQLASPDFRFVMAGYNGEKLTIEQLKSEQPWKTGKRRKEGPNEYAEAITFSEIRHAYRKKIRQYNKLYPEIIRDKP